MADLAEVPSYPVTATGILGPVSSASDTVTGYAAGQLTSAAFSATIQCQGSFDNGTTWVALQIVNMADGTTSTGITANGIYRADVGGVPRHRWYCSAFASATSAKFFPTKRQG